MEQPKQIDKRFIRALLSEVITDDWDGSDALYKTRYDQVLSYGEAAVQPLLEIVKDETIDNYNKRILTSLLADLGNTEIIPVFIEQLNDKLAYFGAMLYIKVFRTKAIPYLLTALQDTTKNERAKVHITETIKDIIHDYNRNMHRRRRIKEEFNTAILTPVILQVLADTKSMARNVEKSNITLGLEQVAKTFEKIKSNSQKEFNKELEDLFLGKGTTGLDVDEEYIYDNDLRPKLVKLLGEIADPSTFELLLELAEKDSDSKVRVEAIEALGKLPQAEASLPLLRKAITDNNPRVREAALKSLGYTAKNITNLEHSQQIAQAVVSKLNDSDRLVRLVASSALSKVDKTVAKDFLLEAISSKDVLTKEHAIASCGDIIISSKDEAVAVQLIEPLLNALTDPNENIRLNSVRALGWALGRTSKKSEILEALVAVLDDTDDQVRDAAVQAFSHYGVFADRNNEEHKNTIEWVAQPLVELFKREIQLRKRPQSDEKSQKISQSSQIIGNLLLAFSHLRIVEATEALIEFVQDESQLAHKREEVIEVLGRIGKGNQQIIKLVRSSLTSKDKHLNRGAIKAAGLLADKEAFDSLIPNLADTYMAQEAAVSIGRLRDERSFDLLVRLIEDENVERFVRWGAILGIGELGDPRSFDVLVKTMRNYNDTEMRYWTIEAFVTLGDERAVEHLEYLGETDFGGTSSPGYDTTIADHALEAIGRITGQPES
jgi:HEAT repeat protein